MMHFGSRPVGRQEDAENKRMAVWDQMFENMENEGKVEI